MSNYTSMLNYHLLQTETIQVSVLVRLVSWNTLIYTSPASSATPTLLEVGTGLQETVWVGGADEVFAEMESRMSNIRRGTPCHNFVLIFRPLSLSMLFHYVKATPSITGDPASMYCHLQSSYIYIVRRNMNKNRRGTCILTL